MRKLPSIHIQTPPRPTQRHRLLDVLSQRREWFYFIAVGCFPLLPCKPINVGRVASPHPCGTFDESSPGSAGVQVIRFCVSPMKKYSTVLTAAFAILPTVGAQTTHYPFRDPNVRAEQRIDNLLLLM